MIKYIIQQKIKGCWEDFMVCANRFEVVMYKRLFKSKYPNYEIRSIKRVILANDEEEIEWNTNT